MKRSGASGTILLVIGVMLLVVTFIEAYLFLVHNISILPITGLEAALGEALAPIMEACVRVLYLAVMGWIGSTVSLRGVSVLLTPKPVIQQGIFLSERRQYPMKPETEDFENAWEQALQEIQQEAEPI